MSDSTPPDKPARDEPSPLPLFHNVAPHGAQWSSHTRFPMNEAGRSVEETVGSYYDASSTFTIIKGFTSLKHLLSFFRMHEIGPTQVNIVLGSEPTVSRRVYDNTKRGQQWQVGEVLDHAGYQCLARDASDVFSEPPHQVWRCTSLMSARS